jgi:hypothetical protein
MPNWGTRGTLLIVAFAVAVLGGIAPVAAQEPVATAAIVPPAVVVALTDVPVRESPPKVGIGYTKAPQRGLMRRNDRLQVTSEVIVRTPYGPEKWIYVVRLSPPPEDRGWAYAGIVGQASCCFRLDR